MYVPKYLDVWKLLNRRKSFSLKSAVRDIDLARGPHLISMWPQVSVPFKITKMRKNYSRLLRPLQQTASTRQTRQRSRRQRFVPSIGNIGIKCYLTPNMPLIQFWGAQTKLNMDEICSLNIHLRYADIPQKVLLKSLHAQRRSFLLLNLQFDAKISLSMK